MSIPKLGAVTFFDKFLGFMFIRKTGRVDENFIDRTNRYYTVIFLSFYNLYLMTDDYIGNPIYCWCPDEFTEQEVKYVHSLCYVSNTYYIPFNRQIPSNFEIRREESTELVYYQWVPLILFLMAFLLFLPRLIWKLLMLKAGMELKKMCIAAKKTIDVSPEQREKGLTIIAGYIDLFCANISRFRGGPCASLRESFSTNFVFGCGRHYGNYFISCKILLRFLYFCVSFGLLFFLNEFLGNRFYIYGYEVIRGFLRGDDWTVTERFPRQTLCDFDLRQLNNVHRWTLQCVLPMNLFNEKFFIILWFWYTMLTFLNILNVCVTLCIAVFPFQRSKFIKKYLQMAGIYERNHLQKTRINLFIHGHLKQDGVYILKQISDNANTVIVQDIIEKMWKLFLKRYDRAGPEEDEIVERENGLPPKGDDMTDDLITATTPLLERNGILKHIQEDEIMSRNNNVDRHVSFDDPKDTFTESEV
ncbi:innexin unc-9-like [Mizuhopecten yessoensis]|uniref:Innexin n=1 Tax=Mizuhopecten yessoensis TaxID=6573 RepID=A0A210QU16_MIZYE|nr:innexin unc-9-like [Mizuhopecten yessoensis]OWF52220.1 Innexin unc-9 [Mizuhopecten yessoensis]